MLPTFLGAELPERVQKWLAYKKKAGVALIDTSQDGINFNNNTAFAGYDDTIKSQTISAIELAIERVESTCSSITGVFRERLNGINQRDAVSNVKLSTQNSFTITKQYTHQMDLLTTELLTDSLNTAKIVWKNGLKGSLILGDKGVKVFTALPEHFTLSDYDINIESASHVNRDMETVKSLLPEFIKSQSLDPADIIEALTSKSMSDLKYKISSSMKRKKKEMDQTSQLQQQLEEMNQQLQQATQQNQQLQQQLDNVNKSNYQLEQEKFRAEMEIDWFKARSDDKYKTGSLDINKKKVDVEIKQMYDGNPYNNEVNWK